MVQQELDMLIKDLIDIKPGSYIKGCKFLDKLDSDIWKTGRRATIHLKGWDIPTKLREQDYEIRTPWFVQSPFPVYNSDELHDLLKSNFYKDTEENEDSYSLEYIGWASFKLDEPIGIHLGSYSLVYDNVSEGIMIYTKILRNNGEVGFIALTTKSVEENELELL